MSGVAAPDSAALLVVHAWLHGTPPRVAARVTSTLDATRPDRVSVAAVGAEEILAEVRRWLDELARSGLSSGDGWVTSS